ncbi:MAG: copper homeostasis protein CutC [Candidatus Acidiferrales bacterium]
MIVEICLDSLESAVAADRGGADRIELCEQLDVGGITPSIDLAREVRAAVKCKMHVLVRSRPGDFVYSGAEVAVMLRQVEAVKALGADGVAVGVLDRNGKIDRADTHELVRRARPMAVTFHRAFDEAPNAERALNDVIVAGCERVLTTGGSKPDGSQFRTAMEGADRLRVLVREGVGRITVLAGGGIRGANVGELIARTGVTEVHSSLIDYAELREGHRFVVREDKVREFIAAAHAAEPHK